MTNADKFKQIFGIYATELWAMPEEDFLKWLNAEAETKDWILCSERLPNNDAIKCPEDKICCYLQKISKPKCIF